MPLLAARASSVTAVDAAPENRNLLDGTGLAWRVHVGNGLAVTARRPTRARRC